MKSRPRGRLLTYDAYYGKKKLELSQEIDEHERKYPQMGQAGLRSC